MWVHKITSTTPDNNGATEMNLWNKLIKLVVIINLKFYFVRQKGNDKFIKTA